ncbi:uncharacterized protein LOC117103868 [Anneissia japonica]|uniref:uncharacterized protein LOC117103868 n=1 Tax=Anneissia japonica TaxID=1529436 RepID=UPI0014256ADE|nr:uncharacterized protein LOC117103868 [Anneissia japonica]
MNMDYYRLETGEMLAGRRISVCFLAAIFSNLFFVPTCHGNLVTSYTIQRCWSDVEYSVATTHTNASTTCFTKNSEDAICYELKSDVSTCKPPWEVVSITDPATFDHIAVAMRNSTLPYFPARISGDLATEGFLNYFLDSSECSSKQVVNGADIQNGSCGLLKVYEANYEIHFIRESCEQFENNMYACSKTLAIGN